MRSESARGARLTNRYNVLVGKVRNLALRLSTLPAEDPYRAQNEAMLLNKLYDMGLPAAFTGAKLGTLFDETYRHGAYAKKYSRALSRLSELLHEARQTIGG